MKLHSSMTALMLGGAAAAASGYACAQQGLAPLTDPLGTEIITVYPLQPNGQAGGAQAGVTMNQISNRNGYALFTSSATASGTITISTATDELLVNVQPNTATWVLPALTPLFDGEQFQFCNVSGAAFATNTQNILAGASTTINNGSTSVTSVSVTTLGSQTCLELVFSVQTKDWYRIR